MHFQTIMSGLHPIDKRVLFELGRDARQSYREIAQRIKSKKEIVAYHVQDLIDRKVITKFVPVFSLNPLGIFSFKIYLRLHGLTKNAEEQLIQKLVQNPDLCWVAKGVGSWDLLLGMYAPDIVTFGHKKDELLNTLSPYIESYDITMIEDALIFNRDYLTEKRSINRDAFIFGGKTTPMKLNDEEKKTLSLIKNNGRFAALTLGKTLQEDPRTTFARIKKLEKRKIIQGYTVFLDLKKIGSALHKLCISLSSHNATEIQRLTERIKQFPHVIHLIKAIGSWEFEIELEAHNPQIAHDITRTLKNEFPQTIKRIDSVIITEEEKIEFSPQTL